MARQPRIVFPGLPHHVVQRSSHGQSLFPEDDDRRQYLEWLRDYAIRYELGVLAWCLMGDHVHLVAVPHRPDSLARALAATHMRHSQLLNRREGGGGPLWQGRFQSCALDEPYTIEAVRYVERDPVRAGLVSDPVAWRWSSAAAHVQGGATGFGETTWPPAGFVGQWRDYLGTETSEEVAAGLRRHTKTGLPYGSAEFIAGLEAQLGRRLRARPRGRPRKNALD